MGGPSESRCSGCILKKTIREVKRGSKGETEVEEGVVVDWNLATEAKGDQNQIMGKNVVSVLD